MDFDPDSELRRLNEALTEQDRAELISDIKEEATDLVFLLHIQSEPDAENRYFHIAADERSPALPPTLLAHLESTTALQDISIDSENNVANKNAALSIRLGFIDARNQKITACLEHPADPDNPPYYSAELIFDDDMPIKDPEEPPLMLPDAIPVAEVSRLLMSICIPSKRGDYSVFDKLDHNDPTIIMNIADALEKKSDATFTQAFYDLDAYGITGHLTHYTEDDILHSVEITLNSAGGEKIRASIKTMLTSDEHVDEKGPAIQFYAIDDNGLSSLVEFDGTHHEVEYLTILRDRLVEIHGRFPRPDESLEDMDRRANPNN